MRSVTSPVLVDREAELQAVMDAAHRARRGEGGVLLVTGEAGIGKSRLCREAATGLSHDVRLLRGRAVATGEPVPYRPFTEAVLSAIRHELPPSTPELTPFRPLLGKLVPQWREPSADLSEPADAVDPVLFAEGVLRLLRALAPRDSAVLAVLEDLHWADAESLFLLGYLADHLGSESVLCVGTVRIGDAGAGERVVHGLAACEHTSVLELRRLERAGVERMVAACTGVSDAAVAAHIAEASDGVPLLIEELLAVPAGGLPGSLAAAVGERLARLQAADRRVVETAAVLGRRVDWQLLAAAAETPVERVAAALDAAVELGLLERTAGELRFRHALTRDAVLDATSPPIAAGLAGAALRALLSTDLDAEGMALAAELAERAGDRVRAAELLLAAGRRAAQAGALRSAESILRRAVATAASDDLTTRANEALCEVLAVAGKPDEAQRVGTGLLTRLTVTDDGGRRRAQLALRLARAALGAGRSDDAAQWLAEARSTASADELSARISVLDAAVALERRDVRRALHLARAAAASAERLGWPETACEAHELLGRCARVTDLGAAKEAFEAELALAHRHGLQHWALRALHELGTIDLLDRADIARLLEARERAERLGALTLAVHLDLQLAAGAHMQFRADESEGYARRARDSALRFGLRPAATFALVFLSNAAAMRRDRDEMTRWADQAVAEAADGSDVPAHLELTSQGIYALITENREDALRHMDRGAAALNAIPASAPAMTRGLWALVREVAGRDGAQARAAVHASGVTVTRMNRACLAYAEAVELGRHGDGERAARLVAAGDADMPAGTESWRHLTHRLVAEAALADGWGEPVDWLVDALGCFESNGLGELAGACRSLLRAAGVRRPPRPHADVPNKLHRAGLTARETDVLRLIVEGLPNRDIAARLHLSPRTVEKHVEALLRKTNTRNRTELARTATEIRIPSSPDT